jgi:predicted transcriptional regulator
MKPTRYRELIRVRSDFGISEATIGKIAGGVSVYVIRQLLLNNSYRPKASTLNRITKGIDNFLALSQL